MPGPVAKLECHPPVAGEERGNPPKPAFVEWRRRRKLKQDRTQAFTKAGGLHRQDAQRFLQVGHPPVMRDAPVRLDGESEVRWNRGDPAGHDVFRLGPVERRVHFDRPQPPGVVAEHILSLEALRIEAAAPSAVGKTRGSDEQLGARRHSATALYMLGTPLMSPMNSERVLGSV